jgi:hypothetical protein
VRSTGNPRISSPPRTPDYSLFFMPQLVSHVGCCAVQDLLPRPILLPRGRIRWDPETASAPGVRLSHEKETEKHFPSLLTLISPHAESFRDGVCDSWSKRSRRGRSHPDAFRHDSAEGEEEPLSPGLLAQDPISNL